MRHDLSWIPMRGLALTRAETAELLLALRSLIDAVPADTPARSHSVHAAVVVARALGRDEAQRPGDTDH
jgi:hypothetical protein